MRTVIAISMMLIPLWANADAPAGAVDLSHGMGTFTIWHWLIVLILVAIPLYFLPGIIAFRRKHRNRVAILVTNIFLGLTGIGWVVALIWAFTADIEVEGGEAETGSKLPRPRVPPTL